MSFPLPVKYAQVLALIAMPSLWKPNVNTTVKNSSSTCIIPAHACIATLLLV